MRAVVVQEFEVAMGWNWPGPMLLHLALLVGMAASAPLRADEAVDRHFLDRAGPLLESRCAGCHGPDETKGGLRVDSREHLLKGGKRGAAIVPGEPARSLLIQSVRHADEKFSMPPKEKLTDAEIASLEKWIRDGAPWPKARKPMPPSSSASPESHERIGDAWSDPRNPIARLFGGERLNLWSLRPLRIATPPEVQNAERVCNTIDRFLLARLESEGRSYSTEADRRTLARRAAYDLTGLPPSTEQLRQFVADESHLAYERLVDELLASPRYGEHQARWWLDVVRYSDSNGFDWDEFRPQAWRYRDYVIRSFNDDKPYDRFVVEQLAGDELLSGPPRTFEEQQALIATGYLRLGPQDNAAGLFNEQARARAELMADLVETTGSAFLGLTLACCRCHDHKYDPLSQADHFRMRAFFEAVRYGDEIAIDLANRQEEIRLHNAGLDARIDEAEKAREAIFAAAKERLASAAAKDKEKETKVGEAAAEPTPEQIEKSLNESEQKRRSSLAKQIEGWKTKKLPFEYGLLMSDNKAEVAETHVLFQGDYRSPREVVAAGVPSVLDPNPSRLTASSNPETTGRRLTLARWIASPENPLTARVLVNRMWQNFFGRGLVATPNDFGLAGERPTHPELLDWLADDFIRSGWSIKSLSRRIVLSAAYRQSSATDSTDARRDSGNTLLGRQNLRRLSAEQIRDSLLAVSGLLTDKAGGAPVWPDLPPEVLQANPAFLDDNAMKTKGWYPSAPAEQGARSIFVIQKRTVRVPFLETFDLPENLTSCPCRTTSLVAPQALTLLNSPLGESAARALAERVRREAGDDASRQTASLFELVLQRSPDEAEKARCAGFLTTRSLEELCRVVLNLNEFAFRD